VRSDAGQLNLAGPITTNATTARNLYLQGAGNGVVNGAISDNASNASGKINLIKEGGGTWTLTAANTYTGATTISAGVLRLGQQSATAVANYSFDNVSGSTVVNDGTGGAGMNGALANGASVVPGGQSGNAVTLSNGASVNINSPIVNMGNTASWTVSAWVKTTTAGSSILTKGNGTGWSNGNTIFYLGDGTGQGSGGIPSGVRHSGGFFQGSTGATAVNDGAWHQVTYVNSNGAYAIYVDGVFQSLSAGNSGFANADVGSVVRLGVSTNTVPADGTINYNGLLDSVQFFGQALSAAQIAALYQGQGTVVVGRLPSATDVSIASGATLDVNGTVQQIGSLSGPAGAAVTLGAGQLTVNSANSTQFAGAISGAGGSLVRDGTGALTLAGANTYTGPTTVNGGALRLATTGSVSSATALTVNGGTLDVAAGRAAAVTFPSVNVGAGGNVDLNDNDLVIGNGTSQSSVEDYVRTARNGGAWNATGGITSTAARNNPSGSTGLGVLGGAEYDGVGGNGTFSGQPYAATDTLVKYTWNGDTNFSGDVNFDDYVRVDVGFNTNLTGWANGDFNYSGSVNFDDYVLIDVAFNTQSGTLGRAVNYLSGDDRSASGLDNPSVQEVVQHFGQFGVPYASAFLAAVPEPMTVGVFGLAAATATLARRRRPR
jgi:autotransporter-associated beta strand protein